MTRNTTLLRAIIPFRLSIFSLLSLAISANGYTLIHAFTGQPHDGANPYYGHLATDGTNLYGLTENGGATNMGTVFKVNPDGSGYEVIHSFTGISILNQGGNPNDGAEPLGSPLVIGTAIYGMTSAGGTNSFFGETQGAIFKVNTDGTGFSLLRTFSNSGPDDGYTPYGSLVTDGANLFGMTSSGNSDEGNLFSISPDGSNFTVLHSFQASGNDGLSPQGSLVLSDGVLYGMTLLGGTANNGTIFRINTDGTGYLKIHDFGGLNNGASPYGSLLVSNSTLYGMTSGGGSGGVGAVFSVATDGSNFQLLHSFSTSELWQPKGDLTLSNSTLYGMTFTSTNGDGGVFQVNTDGTGYQIVHAFTYPADLTDGSIASGSLLLFNSQLYGMTTLGGSATDVGAVFSLAGDNGGGGGPVGSLKVTILPAAAVTAGGQWEVDLGGSLFDSGVTVSNLSVGQHTVYFKDLRGWATAPTANVTITADTTTSITGTYTQFNVVTPTVTITTPAAKMVVSNVLFQADGTAAATGSVLTGVYYQLNGGPWTLATSVNEGAVWAAPGLILTPGSNVFSAYATDVAGGLSVTDSVTFTYIASARLVVNTNGAGTIKPNLNGELLQVGKAYSMTAKAAKGFAFVGWTGSSSTNGTKLTFKMAPSDEFTANFKDIARPVNVILSPTKNQVVSNAEPVATGRAKDNVGVTSVQYRVNGGEWIPAILSDGTNWTTTNLAPFLLSGTNSVSAFAHDAAGNASRTNTVPFKYVTP